MGQEESEVGGEFLSCLSPRRGLSEKDEVGGQQGSTCRQVPVSFQLTHMLHYGGPVVGSWLLLQPFLQLLKVLRGVVSDNDLPEGLAC